MRKNQTPAEKKLWFQFLKFFIPQFYRQKPLDFYIADFYCPKLKLVIELDGHQHLTKEGLAYDEIRTNKLSNGYGPTVLRFPNSQVLHNFPQVCQIITNHSQPPFSKGGAR